MSTTAPLMRDPYAGNYPAALGPGRDQTPFGSVVPSMLPNFGSAISVNNPLSGLQTLGMRPSFATTSQGLPKFSSVRYLGAADRAAMEQARIQATIEQMAAQQGQGAGAIGDTGNPTGGNWANVNQWNSLIAMATDRVRRETGITVPNNIVKAVMELESGGVMVGCNSSGYCGLMQTGSGSWINNYQHAYNLTPEGNIYYGVQELANWFKATGSSNWEDAAAAYFSGYNYNKPWVSDGHYTVGDYRAHIARNLATLNAAGGGGGGNFTGGSSQAFNAITGGTGSISQGFGLTDWAMGGGRGMYGYSSSYTPGGAYGGHIGIDVGVPMGTTLYSPVSGRVVVSGGSGFYYNTEAGRYLPNQGELKIKLSNGDELILGHMSQINVPVGTVVQAGQAVGRSGYPSGPHVHVEYRQYNPGAGTSTGYVAVDPRTILGGMIPGLTGGTAQPSYGWSLPSLSGRSVSGGGSSSPLASLRSAGVLRY